MGGQKIPEQRSESGEPYPFGDFATLEALIADRDRLAAEHDQMTGERDVWQARAEALEHESKAWQYLAEYDQMTGLLNKMGWRHRMEQRLASGQASGQATGVLMLDINKFKEVNDTYGHDAGDALLVDFGEFLASKFRRRQDMLTGHMSGDEFIIGLNLETLDNDPHGYMDRVYAYAQATTAEFIASLHPSLRELGLGVSIGVAVSTRQLPFDLQVLLMQADESMYEEKDRSRGRPRSDFAPALGAAGVALVRQRGPSAAETLEPA